MPAVKTTIYLANGHAVLLDGLRLILEEETDFAVTGMATNGHDAVHEIGRQKPDIAILESVMSGLNGIDATREIVAGSSPTRVIILSAHASQENVLQALSAGASGFVPKTARAAEIVDAIRRVRSGTFYLSASIESALFSDSLWHDFSAVPGTPFSRLTQRERQVLQLVVEGKTSAEIGTILSLAPNTISSYRSRLMRKLGVKDVVSLVRYALQHGLTTSNS